MSRPRRAARPWPEALLAAYPAWWRDRYQAEVELLIGDLRADGRRQAAMAADLLCGAVGAWLNVGRTGMSERTRGSLITVLWCWAICGGAAAFFGHDLSIYPSRALAARIDAAHPAVPAAFAALYVAGLVGIAATVVAAVAFAVPTARQALRERRPGTLALMAVSPVSAAVWLAVFRFVISPAGAGPARLALGVCWLLAGLAGAALSLFAVGRVVRATTFSAAIWRVGVAAAMTVTIAMLVATGATLAWGLAIRTAQAPPADAAGWLTAIAVMAAATGRAIVALLRAGQHPGERQIV
ncbi:MAG: hypothetical protein ACYCVZ_11855 [Streptosporangiaceae bacterium]